MKSKEKIMIALITVIILVAIFLAFLFSNSQKTPSKITIQNDDGKTIEAVLFGYTWKVFGKEMIADSVDPYEYDYASSNTILSRTAKNVRILLEDKAMSVEGNYRFIDGQETEEATFSQNSSLNSINVSLPHIEGTYIYVFRLTYAKGTAEYGFKVVITDENVYEVGELAKFKETSIVDYEGISNLLSSIPYADSVDGITMDEASKSMQVRYDVTAIDKEDLLNNAVAMFVLIPELESITYELNSGTKNNEIYYNRTELNHIFNRDISEYANDSESWTKEVIYKETDKRNHSLLEAYATVIHSVFTAAEQNEKSDSLVLIISGDSLDEYNKIGLFELLKEQYKNIVSTTKDITIPKAEKLELNTDLAQMIITASYTSLDGDMTSKQFAIRTENGNMMVQEMIEEVEDIPNIEVTEEQE